jgi:hypothetical protein
MQPPCSTHQHSDFLPFASGTSFKASAAALMTKSLTETLIPCLSVQPNSRLLSIERYLTDSSKSESTLIKCRRTFRFQDRQLATLEKTRM